MIADFDLRFNHSDVEDGHVTIYTASGVLPYHFQNKRIVLLDNETGDTYLGDVNDWSDDEGWIWVELA